MKTLKKLTGSLLSIFILFAVLLSTLSCEIGLGASVDTDPPSLSIDASIVDSTIAGDFDIEGTYSDDGSIEDIHAVLKRTDGTGSSIKIEGYLGTSPEKRGEGIWKIPVKAKTSEITDGSYQVTVSIKDGVGRVTTQSTTFTIDNTPPVLILTKPNSNPGDETVSAYGQRVFLEGSIADTAKETYITVEFFDNPSLTGTPLDVIKTSAIAPTDVNSNNAKLTIYKEDSYNKIYRASAPNKKEGSKDVYIKITAEDIAGNSTTDFYFSKDLAKNITKSSGDDAFGLAPIDIYNILNNTDALKNKERSAADVTKIKELLSANARQKAMFSLNPENSPYFTVSGMKTLTKSGKDFESSDNGYWVINGAQTLEVSVFMGSDSIELVDDDNFYVYALECNEYGEPVKEDIEANRIKLYSKSRETGSGINKKTYYSIGGKQGHKTTSGAYVFTVPMSRTLRPDPDSTTTVDQRLEYKNYLIFVSGKDNEGNPVEPNETGYGFHFTAGTGAPVLNLTEPADNTVFHKKGEGLRFKGSTKSEEGVPKVTVWNGNTKIADIQLETEIEGELNNFDKLLTVEDLGFPNKSETYSITIKATSGDQVTESKFSVWYDVDGPEIDIKDNAIQPVVVANGKNNNINGKLKVNGTIIDSFDQFGSAILSVLQNGNAVNATITHLKKNENGNEVEDKTVSGTSLTLGSSFNFKLDTTKLTNNKAATLKIEATDRVGNKSTWTKEFYVDQSTDKPSIKSSDKEINKGIGTEGLSFVEAGNNLFVRGGNLVLSVTDDDGIDYGRVIIQAYDKATGTLSPAAEKQDLRYDSASVISHTLPTDVGLYMATVTVYDTSFVSESQTPNNFEKKQFFLRVTGNGPDVSITPDSDYIQTGAKYVLTFNITDEGNKPYKLKINNATNPVLEDINTDEFTYDYTPSAGERSVKFTVIDKNSSFTDKVFESKFDDEAPNLLTISSLPSVTATEEDSYLFKGLLNDTRSGVEKVQIKFTDVANNKDTGWIEVESFSKTKWNYEAIWSGSERSVALEEVFTAENEKTVIVKAIDGAGNETTTTPQTFKYDKYAPEVTIAALDPTDGKTDVTLNLTIKDTNPDRIEVTVKDSDGNLKDSFNVTSFTNGSDARTKNATATIAKTKLTADGDYSITVKGIDKNGRESGTKTTTLKRDTSGPTVQIKAPADDTKVNERALNETTQFSLRLDDAGGTGVAKVFYKFTHAPEPGSIMGIDGGYTQDPTSDGPYTIDIPFIKGDASAADKVGKLDEGHWYLHVYAVDEAGNVSALGKRRFDIDFSNPSLTVTINENTTTKYKTDGIYYFKGDLTGTISASDTAGSVTTTYSIDGATPVALTGTSSWTLSTNLFTASSKQTLVIKTTDDFNKTTTQTFEVYKDINPPNISGANQDPVNSAPTLGGTVNDKDGNSDGVGVAKVLWSKTSATATDFEEIADYVAGSSMWYYDVPAFSDSEPEETKNYWFKAVDALGNETATPAIISFEYDKAPPSITITGESAEAIYKTANSFTIAGTAYDSNKLKKIYIEQNGELIDTITTGAVKNYNWSKTFAGVEEGRHTFSVYAEDEAGKKSQSRSQEIIVDKNAPTLAVTNPANNNSKLEYALKTNTTFKGTVQDSVAGVDKVYCLISKSAPANTAAFKEAVIANGEWTYTSSTLAEDLGYKLYVYAVDKAGNTTATGTNPYVIREFDVDNENPEITLVSVGEQYNSTTASPFTVEVSATDTHEIPEDGVTISWGTAAGQSATMSLESGKYKKQFAFGRATAPSGVTKLNDGNYTFTITVKDKANKPVTETKTVMIDTTAPEIGTLKINGTALNASDWYGSKTLAVSVDVTDSVSKVKSVKYSLDNGSTWSDFYQQGTGNTWGGTVDFVGGSNTIKVKATDYADNTNNDYAAQTVNIDDTAAELSALYYQVGSNPVTEIASTVYVKKDSSGTGAITVYGKYYDGESGIKESLQFTIGTTLQTLTSIGYTTQEGAGDDPTAAEIKDFTFTTLASNAKYWKAVFTPSVEGSLTISGKNNANKPSSESPSKIKIDDKPPVLSNITLSNSYQKDSTTFFVNNEKVNNQEKTFTLEGVATDNYGLVDVTLRVTSGSNTLNPAPANIGDDVSSWKFEISNMSSWSTSATATLTLTDISGHVTTLPVTINFDTTPPDKVIALDAKGKDLYFRIGKADNDDNAGVTSDTGAWNDALDKDVGKKYEENSYGNDNTIQLRGRFEDGEGSGVKMIYYKLYTVWDGNTDIWGTSARSTMTNLTSDELNTLISNVGIVNAIKPGEDEERRVFYNVTKDATDSNGGTKFKNINSSYDQYFKNIKTNFNASISGFKEGVNYLVFVVEDNVGNKKVIETGIGDTKFANFKINVDNDAPEITSNASGIITTRSSETFGTVPPVKISGTLKDSGAGVNEKTFEVTIDNKSKYSINGVDTPVATLNKMEEKTDSNGKKYFEWEIEIPVKIMAAVGKNSFSVMASVKDNAGTGNLKTDSIASISLDDIPPTMSFTSSGGIIKDSIDVSVYANDANGIKDNKVYYNLYNSTDTDYETPLLAKTDNKDPAVTIDSGKGSYEISIDTRAAAFTDNQKLILRVYAKDGAGNVGYLNSNLYTIDKNAPALVSLNFQKDKNTAIGHTAITTDTWFKSTALTINGTFKDVISGENATTEGSGVKVINYKVGTASGTITPKYDETNKVYTFSANIDGFEEKAANSFEIWAEDDVGNEETSHHPLKINVDATQPSIEVDSNLPDYSNGKTYKVSGTFGDGTLGSGVASIVVKLGTGNTAKTHTISNPTGSTWTYDIPETDLTAYANNQVKIEATATDKAGNASVPTIKQIIVDMQEPVVKLESPQNAKSGPGVTDTYVNGVISLSGTSNDNYIIDSVAGLLYSTTQTTKPAKGVVTSIQPWTAPSGWEKLDENSGIEKADGSNNSKWGFEKINTTKTEFNGKTIYFTAAVIDKAGNVGYADPIKVIVDQDTNRPVIKITSMLLEEMTSSNHKGSTESEITGNVSDDDGVPKGLKYKDGASDTFKTDGLVYSTSDGQFTLTLDDGEHDIYFEVETNELNSDGTTYKKFTTMVSPTDTQLFDTPKLTDRNGTTFGEKGTNTNKNTVYYMYIDKEPPEVKDFGYSRTYNAASPWSSSISSEYFGGPDASGKNKFYITQTAKDANGVKKVYLTIPADTGDGESQAITAWEYKSGSVTKTVYTKGNKPGSDAGYWSDFAVIGTTLEESSKKTDIASVADGYTSITIGTESYNRKTYIFALEDTESGKGKKEYHIWKTPQNKPIDVTGLVSGEKNATLYTYDGTRQTTESKIIRVDNTNPEFNIDAPTAVANTAIVKGNITNETSNVTVEYAVTRKTVTNHSNVPASDWQPENKARLSYRIVFDGDTSETETHTDLFRIYLTEKYLGITSVDEINGVNGVVPTYTDLTDVNVWIHVIDSCGNEAWKYETVTVDPQGTRPTVKVGYPANGETLGGSVSIMGTAQDDEAPKFAWLQFDFDGTSGWGEGDYNLLKDKYTFGDMSTNGDVTASTTTANKAIKVPVNGGAWNFDLESTDLFPNEDTTTNTVTMSVYATDEGCNKSVEVKRTFTVDKTYPYFDQTSLKLVQYEDNDPSKAKLKEQPYVESMSIRGIWWLEGNIKDDSGIQKITVSSNDAAAATKIDVKAQTPVAEQTSGAYLFTKIDESSKEFEDEEGNTTTVTTSNYSFKIKVGGDGNGAGKDKLLIKIWEYKLVNALDNDKTFIIYYDNVAPTLADPEDSSTGIATTVKNSNGFYGLHSTAYEKNTGDTGVDKVAVYFTRNYNDTDYIFDPMYKKTATASKMEITNSTFTKSTDDKLYWGEATIASIDKANVILSADPASYVHVGGLAKVNGVVYRISGVNATDKKVTLSVSGSVVAPADNKIYFAVANVVDNTLQEKKPASPTILQTAYGYGYAAFEKDDGDKVMEYLQTVDTTTWNWEMYINSKNIPDGSIQIHYVVFDKAGNTSIEKVIDASVENNKPHLVSVQIALDSQQDGTVGNQAGETENYYPLEMTERATTYKALGEANEITVPAIVVKSEMWVTPEIVGGNGAINYKIRKKGQSDYPAGDGIFWANSADDTNAANWTDANDYVSSEALITRAAKITHDKAWYDSNIGANDPSYSLEYMLFDSKEDTTKNTVYIKIPNINFEFYDTEAPEVEIKDFDWQKDANGIITSNVIYEDGKPQGHIELHGDLEFTGTTFSSSNTNELDLDDKVSGKIKIEGTTSDNRRLSALYLSITGMGAHFGTGTGNAGLTTKTVGTGANAVTYYQLATYDKATGWTVNKNDGTNKLKGGSLANYGYTFEVSGNSFEGNRHSVNWTLEWDSAMISSVAAADVKIQVLAEDAASEVSTDNKNKEASKLRQVDVVPYITEISTELSKGNKNHPTVLSRSARGLYPVRRGSSITVEGFNFKGTDTGIAVNGTNITSKAPVTYKVKNGDEEVDVVDTSKLTVTLDNANLTSGGVVATVADISSLNNMTSKTVGYNSEANGQNNDLLTDKREVWVVDVTTTVDTKDKRKLDMVINGTTITFGAGYQDSYYSTMVASGTSLSNIQNLRNSFTRYFDSAIDANDDGTIFTVSSCGDTYMGPVTAWGNGPSHFALTRGDAGSAAIVWEYDRKSSGSSGYTPSTNTKKIYLESNWNGANLNNLERILWPNIVVTGGNSATKGYISYYDTTQKLIKFRYFTSDGSKVANNFASYQAGTASNTIVEGAIRNDLTTTTTAYQFYNNNAWRNGTNNRKFTFSQGYTSIAGADCNSAYSVTAVSGTTALVAWYDASSGALKLKYNESPATSYSGYQVFNTLPTAGTITFKISIDGGTAKDVSVTYATPSGGDAKHEFAYQLNLILSNGYGAYAEVDPAMNKVVVRSMQTGEDSSISITNLSSGTVYTGTQSFGSDPYFFGQHIGAGSKWEEITIDTNSAGQFVAMKTDSKGGIHFAYYDTGNGDLKYAYMSSVTATPVVVTVDGYQQVGQYVDLAIKENADGSQITPYISYYSMSNADTKRSAKVAKLVSPITYNGATANASSVKDGSVDELFTGAWEAYHVPTAGIPVQYRVNIGVTSDGNVYISYLADRIIEYVKVE